MFTKTFFTVLLTASTLLHAAPLEALDKVKRGVTTSINPSDLAIPNTVVESDGSNQYTVVEPAYKVASTNRPSRISSPAIVSTLATTVIQPSSVSSAAGSSVAKSSAAGSSVAGSSALSAAASSEASSSSFITLSGNDAFTIPLVNVSTYLSETGTTTTSTLFTLTSSSGAGISGLTGTVIDTTIGTANPTTSIGISSSSLTVSVNTTTLTSDKIITSSTSNSTQDLLTLTLTQATALSTSKYTSESVSETTKTLNSVSETTQTFGYQNSSSLVSSVSTSTTIIPTSTQVSSSTVTVTSASVVSSTYTTIATIASTDVNVDLFQAIETGAVPSSFNTMENAWDFDSNVDWTEKSEGYTNKFYINLLLSDQEYPAFVYPYVMWQSVSTLYGFAVQHTTKSDYTFAQYMDNGNPRIFTNPLDQYDLVFSSTSFNSANDYSMTVADLDVASVSVTLTEDSDSANYIYLPIVEGMGLTTAVYHGSLIPRLDSGMNIQSLTVETSANLASGVSKYRIYINNIAWIVYVTNPYNDDTFSLSTTYGAGNGYSLIGNIAVDGLIIQATVAPDNSDDEQYFDKAAGMYVTGFSVKGSSNGITSTYYYDYTTEGSSVSGSPLVYVLPHQIEAVSSASSGANTGITIAAITRGYATAFLSASIEFTETLNTEISWLPWSSQLGSDSLKYSADIIQKLASAATSELGVDIWSTIENLNSYYLGKIVDKYAYITLVCSDIIEDADLTASALSNLKTAFNSLIGDSGYFNYDEKFGGIITNNDWDSITDTYDNFGNSHYNDHHFHYGYIIHAAAVLGHVDALNGGTWAEDNKSWVNALIRDVANPSKDDTYFPTFRYFDWYTGHSWASGLDYNINGLNEESTSEDYNFAYGMKMWAEVIGDTSMRYRADTMIQILSRAMESYFLFDDNNDVIPSEMISNKVAGISFQNYLDYTTYFGNDISYIHGIQMIPITPVSGQMRSVDFVTQEWDEMLSSYMPSTAGGWRGLLRLNQALIDPKTSYEFFSASDASDYLDNGMSLTWSLAFSGGLAYSLGLL